MADFISSQLSTPKHPLLHLTSMALLHLRVTGLAPTITSSSRSNYEQHRNTIKGKIEGRVIRVADPVRNAVNTILPLLSAGPEVRDTSPALLAEEKRKGNDDGRQKYYVNLGYAIRTLREEFPVILNKEPSFDIYRDDIVFKDPVNTFSGIDNYKLIFWALRLNGWIFFKTLWVDIVSVWQPAENIIMIRWTVHGIPRVPWESHGRFDGTSEYKLDKDGKIYEHRVDNVAINSPPRFRILQIEELILSLGCPSPPKPTCFETTPSLFISYLPFLLQFTWIRYYLALHLTLTWRYQERGG